VTETHSSASSRWESSDSRELSLPRRRWSFVDLPISLRLLASILLSTVFAIVLLGAVLAWRTLADARVDLLHRLEALAGVIEAETASSLIFRDEMAGRRQLAGLGEVPEIVVAELTDPAGRSMGRYLRDPLEHDALRLCDPDLESPRLVSGFLVSSTVVRHEGAPAGRLCLVADTPGTARLLPRYGGAFLLVSGVVILLGVGLASWLTRTVSRPVIALADAVTVVSRGGSESSTRVDVTSRDELGRLAAAINRLLRTLQDRERDLRAAKEEAERASRVKSQFLASMSHELRTPLNGVLGMTDLLAMTALDGEQREYLETIQISGTLLLAVINDILDFSRLESGRMELHSRRFELEAAIREALEVCRASMLAKPVTVTCEIRPSVPRWLVGDDKRLRQILVNLVGNAIKFTERGSVEIRADELSQEGGRSRLLFRVRDTGIGISEADQQHLFEAFHQASHVAEGEYHGSGLGLAICARLLHLLGGEIWVESEVGKGSDFFFTVDMVVATEAGSSAEMESLTAASDRWLGPLRVLVVDDNEVNRRVTRSQLQALGAKVAEAANGGEAMERVASDEPPYDLVLMDCRMPGIDGFEATRRLRSLEGRRAATPVVGLTAYALEEDRHRCLAAGMDGYLAKPVTLETLADEVRRHTGRAGARARAASEVAKGTREKLARSPAGSAPPAEPPVIDEATWGRLARLEETSGKGLRRELAELFVESLAGHRSRLVVALDSGSADEIAAVAHGVKGSAGNLGGRRAQNAAEALETTARRQGADACPDLAARLFDELDRLEAALRGRM
jgi:signal transduction histidine kinase/DNA-binding NarL/FixJ family response regulator